MITTTPSTQHRSIRYRRLMIGVGALAGLVVLLATTLLYLLYRKVRNANQQLRHANDQLAYNSLHDPLTGLLNRRSLHEFMQKRTEQGERRQLPTATTDGFILLDIDYFKHINDHHGHAAGDVVLIEVGRRLKQLTRQGDMVLRWGGEEFLIVLRNLNQTALTNFTNRALQVIGSEPVIYQNVSIQVTASAGFLTLPFAGVDEHLLDARQPAQRERQLQRQDQQRAGLAAGDAFVGVERGDRAAPIGAPPIRRQPCHFAAHWHLHPAVLRIVPPAPFPGRQDDGLPDGAAAGAMAPAAMGIFVGLGLMLMHVLSKRRAMAEAKVLLRQHSTLLEPMPKLRARPKTRFTSGQQRSSAAGR